MLTDANPVFSVFDTYSLLVEEPFAHLPFAVRHLDQQRYSFGKDLLLSSYLQKLFQKSDRLQGGL